MGLSKAFLALNNSGIGKPIIRLVLIFSILTIINGGTPHLLFVKQQSVFLPLLQPGQEQTAYAFHTQALRNTTSHAIQIVQSVEQNLNDTHEALLNANLTDAFFHLGVAQRDLSVLKQGNATIGMYNSFPTPLNVGAPSLLGQIPAATGSSFPPAIISSSPQSSSLSSSSPGTATATGGAGPLIGGESTTGIEGESTTADQTAQPTQSAQQASPIQPNQQFQTFQPSESSQASQASQPSQPSQSFQPTQPSQPTQPTQPSQPTRPIIPSG
jgi:hypothetical protein